MPTSPNVAVASGVNVPTTTETVITTTTARVVAAPASQGEYISGVINLTPGTGTTAAVIRIRAGSGTGGAIIGGAETSAVTAGANINIPFAQMDFTLSGTVQYTLTIQQTGATANGTVNFAAISEQTSNSAGA